MDLLTTAGIGASAGGVEALRSLFREVRAGARVSYIVLLHLDPSHDSELTRILARDCALPVTTATHGTRLEPDQVYVAPPAVLVTVADGRLVLSPAEPSLRDPRSIDVLFSSLAEGFQDRAVGIVLSGFGHDGTIGIKAIKEHGGLTIAQGGDGDGPAHGGMPESAIAGGQVDLVLPVGDIAHKLAEYAASLDAGAAIPTPGEGSDQNASRAAICAILRREVGHDFAGYKDRTFLRRVHRRMQILHMPTLEAYVAHLDGHHEEAVALLGDLLISVTAFFRDEDSFAHLAQEVLPGLFNGKGAEDMVRVWVPACASGEEAYSIAMLLCEHAGTRGGMPQLRIFATDIDEAALAVARAGHYPLALLRHVSPERLKRFFEGEGLLRTVTKEIRDICVFSSHSLIRDPPFSRLDLISCRNLLIYLDARAQREVFPLFHFALRPGGHLMLGSAESAVQFADLFTPIDKHYRIYRRRDDVAPTPRFPAPRGLLEARGLSASPAPRAAGTARTLRQVAETTVLDRFAPAHVVVTREGAVVHYSAHTGPYLEAAPGEPTRILLSLARRELRLDIRLALEEVVRSRRAVTRRPAASGRAGETGPVTITAMPLPEEDPAEPLFLIVFADTQDPPPPARSEPQPGPGEALAVLTERELRDTRERLQAVIEEYESAVAELRAGNEELVSVNEELQSANEELETAKEEQQSVNEELHLLNQELKGKLLQLDRANADLSNMFEATRVATVTLGHDLTIRGFTPAITSVFNLLPGDYGRPLADIAGSIDSGDILREAREVLTIGKPIEHRVDRRDGTAQFLLRLVPYLMADGKVDGVLASFVDVTPLLDATRENEQQRLLVAELNHRVGNILNVVIALTRQTLRDGTAIEEARDTLVGRMEALTKAYQLVSRESWRETLLAEVVSEQLAPHLSTPGRGVVSGPRVWLQPSTAVAFGLVVHELATNAVKYGALSNEVGQVAVSWARAGAEDPQHLDFRWQEVGGPAPERERKAGFGTQLLKGQVTHGLGGSMEEAFAPEGYSLRLSIPLGEPQGPRLE